METYSLTVSRKVTLTLSFEIVAVVLEPMPLPSIKWCISSRSRNVNVVVFSPSRHLHSPQVLIPTIFIYFLPSSTFLLLTHRFNIVTLSPYPRIMC